ncbi:MAG: HAD-IA family hydrolase [Hyphomicrobiales bacterium]|nr:HAD-IA family hydrolase [Hyphomicrobiales bacterium]
MRTPAAALLFDLDGTLVDTDDLHFEAFVETMAPHGVALTRDDYRARVMGAANEAIGATLLPHLPREERARALDAKEAAYRARLGSIAPTAGVVALLDWAEARGLSTAVVTNAPRANVGVVLDGLGLAARLPEIVVAEELARGKPDPLPYVPALERRGADAARSVAFEDSLSGIAAALGAGLAVVGVTSGLPAERLLAAGAAIAVADFADARVRALIEARSGA